MESVVEVDSITGTAEVVVDTTTVGDDVVAVSMDSRAETTAGVTPATINKKTPVMLVKRD